MMNILLIRPYLTTAGDERSVYLTEPLALVLLATYLENEFKDTVKIKVLDLYEMGNGEVEEKDGKYVVGLSDENIICEHIKAFNPDLVGITSAFSFYFQDSLDVAQLVADNFKDAMLVLGGTHATLDTENILKENPCIDAIVRNEGEETLAVLVKELMENPNSDLSKIEGVYYRQGDEVVGNEDREFIKDLDSLPMPDRKFINMDFYNRTNTKRLSFVRSSPVASVVTSRGCPIDCVFCVSKAVWKRQYRSQSAEAVFAEIKYLYETYGIREIAFMDEQFIVDRKRVEKICDYVIESDMKLSLCVPQGTSVWLLNEPILKKMKKAGFYRLAFPIESGCEKTLEFIKKPVDLKQVNELIRTTNKLGFWTQAAFIIGFPYETREDIMTTVNYALECGVDYPIFNIAKPFAGSDMYEIYEMEGLVDDAVTSSGLERSDHDTVNLKAAEINEIYQKASRDIIPSKIRFFLNPKNFYNYFLSKFRTYDDIKYFLKLMCVLFINQKVDRLARKYSFTSFCKKNKKALQNGSSSESLQPN